MALYPDKYSFEDIENYRLEGPGGELELRGYIQDAFDMMEIYAEDNFGRHKGPGYERSVYGNPNTIQIEKNVNRELENVKKESKQFSFEEITGFKDVKDVPGVSVYKGTDNYFNSTSNNQLFNKQPIHDDITMNQLATSRG